MTEESVRAAVHYLRHRYAEAVRKEVPTIVQRPEDVEAELQHLFAALS